MVKKVSSHICNTNSAILWKILEVPKAFPYISKARICWLRNQEDKDIAPPVYFYIFLTFNIFTSRSHLEKKKFQSRTILRSLASLNVSQS